jgi:hypothetical protein
MFDGLTVFEAGAELIQEVRCTNLAHKRATRVAQACITTTTIKPCAEHIVSDSIQWQEEGSFAALSC